MIDINKEIEKRRINSWLSKRFICKDGFEISIQASHCHYCSPRLDSDIHYEFELGFPSSKDELIMEYAADKNDPKKTVYGWVPIDVVEKLIEKHGGLVD